MSKDITKEDLSCRLEVYISKNGEIHREAFSLGPYDEEKDRSGYYKSLHYKYPKESTNPDYNGDCVCVWVVTGHQSIQDK